MKLTYFQTIFLLAPSLITAKPLVMRGTAEHIETPEEFAAGTVNLQATGSCRAYLSTKQDLTICAPKCASTPPEDAATVGVLSSTSCVWTSNGMDNSIFTDPTKNQYHIGVCECNIPLLDQLVGTVVMALPAIGEIACSVLFNSFDKVIELGLLVIPEGKILDASIEAGVKAAKTILENGEKASAFAQWFDPCGPKVEGAHDYAADIDMLFQQYTTIPDTLVKGNGCKGGKCPNEARDTLTAAAAKPKPKGPDPVKPDPVKPAPVKPSAPVEKPSAPPVVSAQKPSASADKPTVVPTTAIPTTAAPVTTAIPTTAVSSVVPSSVAPTTVLSSVASSLAPTGVSSIVSSAVPSQASSAVSSVLASSAVSSVLSSAVSSVLPSSAVSSILTATPSGPTTLLTSALPTTLAPTSITSAPGTEPTAPAEGVCDPFDIACLNGQLDPLRSITDALSLTLFPSSTGAPFPTANSSSIAVPTSVGVEVTATAVGTEITGAPTFTAIS